MANKRSHLIRELFTRNKRDLLAYFTRRVGREDASDLLQETFVRILRHGQFEAVADPLPFLQQIANNLARDFARRGKTEAKYFEFGDLPQDAPSGEAPPDARIEADEQRRLLFAAIETLPPRCREVFALHMYDSLPLAEIAKRLGISKNMTHKHMRLALQRCFAALD
jgi:RNA polymerase sigma-70 factor (ECF subfamily)